MPEISHSSSLVTNAQGQTLLRYLQADCLTLILARHGQRGGPPLDGFPGRSLTPMGHRQARRLARRVAQIPLHHLYASDMARAYQTAEAVHALRPEVPFTVLADLRELSSADQPDYPPEITPEQRAQLHQQRVDRVVARLRATHRLGEVILIVAHGGMNNRLLAAFSGLPGYGLGDSLIKHHNAALTIASIGAEGQMVIRLANCTRHLLPSQLTMTSRD